MRMTQCELPTQEKKTVQNILTKVTITSKNKELELTAKETECMGILKQSDIPVCNILLKGERIEQVGTFKLSGFTITPDARCGTEVTKRKAFI